MNTPYTFEHIPFAAVAGNPRNGEGDVIELADGRLLLVYGEFYDTADHAAATLQGVHSSDGGRTWTGKHTVQENIGGRNVMSVSLLRLADGDILLSFLRKDHERMCCTPFARCSSDEGVTWSAPAPVATVDPAAYYVVNNDRTIQTESGRVLMPASVLVSGESVGTRVCISDDAGRSWRVTGNHPFLPASKTSSQEPGLIELRDGRLMMWCRCDLGQIYRCHSADGGETYGDWEPMGLKAPTSPAAIKRLPSTGEHLCIFNNHETPPAYWAVDRAPLTAAVSGDEGETWRIVGDLEPDRTRSCCYVSTTFLPSGEILLTYYLGETLERVEDGRFLRRHRNLAHLKVATFPESWLHGAT